MTVAVGLLPAVSVLGVLAREESARERVGEFPARERIVQVAVHAREGRRSRAGH